VRNRIGRRRLTQLLALAALTVGLLPGTADAAEGGTGARNAQIGQAATWSLVATLDPAHVQTTRSVLTLYGVYAFTPILVKFNPKVLDPSINQSVVPQHASWNSWALRNANNDHWLWYSVDIYEQIS
jgi:hypothetical protein